MIPSDSSQTKTHATDQQTNERNVRTAAKMALRARHGAELQFVAADGGETLPYYDSIDWTGVYVYVFVWLLGG